MALMKCKECGHEISKKAKKCPFCGAPNSSHVSPLMSLIVIVLAIWFFAKMADTSPPDSQTASNTSQAPTQVHTVQTKPKAAKLYHTGETAHIGYTSYAVWKLYYRNKLSDNPYLNQPPDASFLFVELTVRNDDNKARTVAPMKLFDDAGAEYETSSKAWGADNNIGTLTSLNPGVQKRGVIVFDVPRGKYYRLKVSGGYWSSDETLIELK